ncbi:hypothetical protein OG369_38840 [Streptomyces sp. NBC_01221]|uniref:hypothetical protein n=1 Tax=Streptomyces sp. NBC_01221 TaxID=2903782 RepID=UPI002254B167|nr:hypothetical protein [Streptomyces sp. NBC_01221]MCX4791820.1 hypothetical protein [Streptomyces sp. NBC_01221]
MISSRWASDASRAPSSRTTWTSARRSRSSVHIGQNTGNIAANSRDFTLNATTHSGVDLAQVVMAARALRQAVPNVWRGGPGQRGPSQGTQEVGQGRAVARREE